MKRSVLRILQLISKGILTGCMLLLMLYSLVILLPGVFGLKTYAVTSGSMEPSIPCGSLVLVDPSDTTPEEGKVMTFQSGGDNKPMIVTHRIKEITEQGEIITKGDANRIPDLNRITQEEIIGTDIYCVRYLGYLMTQPELRVGILAGIGSSVAILAWINQIEKQGEK
ncbi:MAG: signal peptidase I [Solobacterium sp.]|nr:signal peptidase I [Solobacterium sp.]